MTISLPSELIYAVDVPEVKDFRCTFHYNYFVPDESVSEESADKKFLERSADEIDSSFIQYSSTRAPRFVSFTFRPPKLKSPNNAVTDYEQNKNSFQTRTISKKLIYDNLQKVVSEDYFSVNDFVSVAFQDARIDQKAYNYVSSSHAFQMNILEQGYDSDVSNWRASRNAQSSNTRSRFGKLIDSSMSQPDASYGAKFYNEEDITPINKYFDAIRHVTVAAQVSSRYLLDITNKAIRDPGAPYASDMAKLHSFAKNVKDKIHPSSLQVSETSFKAFADPIDVYANQDINRDYKGPELVGYIIEKKELMPDGKVVEHEPIVIDSPNVSTTADFRVKYNTYYVYSIKTVALITMPAIDDDSGKVVMTRLLVTSKPRHTAVQTVEMVAPPPPSDVNFTWDYSRVNPTTMQYDSTTGQPLVGTGTAGSLMVHWTLPPNTQRDIKKFQVFRRSTVEEPFELIKEYDFDDSLARFHNKENVDPKLTERVDSPMTFLYDDDFLVGSSLDSNSNDQNSNAKKHPWSSTYIYAIACIDAHGLTSNYSAQFEVWFDLFTNKIHKRLISHQGAPKPYPNMYLQADLFVDTMRVSGAKSKKFKLYFNPEFYRLVDDQDKKLRVYATTKSGGKYKLQFINTDNQKSATVTVTINDQISQNWFLDTLGQ